MRKPSKRDVGWVFAALAIASTIAVAAATGVSATPGVSVVSELLAQGESGPTVEITSPAGTDVAVAKNTFSPGGSSGWHAHPGMAVLVVASGELTIYREPIGGGKCTEKTLNVGDTYFERPSKMLNGVNKGTTDAVVIVTFFNVPHSGSARIDVPDPGDCPTP